MATKIRGIEGMKHGELDFELQRGVKFVLFQYCISVVILTFRRSSDIFSIRQGENAVVKGLPFTLLSLVAGWWGIPWGPIYTIQSVYNNSCGGQGCDAGSPQFAARAGHARPGSLSDSSQELIARSITLPPLRVKYGTERIDGGGRWVSEN